MGDINSTKADSSGVIVRTICEVHREIYREIYRLSEDGKIEPEVYAFLVTRLEEAFEYAKKMNNKLKQYKHNYDEGWWRAHRLDGGALDEIDRIQSEIRKTRKNS